MVVQAVAAFVDTAEEAGGKLPFEDPRGHSHVTWMKGRGEGMGRKIEAALLEIVPHRRQDESSEFELPGRIVGVIEEPIVNAHR